MADQPIHPPEIARLLEQADAARTRLGRGVEALRERLDVPTRLVGSLRGHPLRWVGGAAVAGLVTTLLVRGFVAPRIRKPKTMAGTITSLVIAAARPALKIWLANQAKVRVGSLVAGWLHNQARGQHPPR